MKSSDFYDNFDNEKKTIVIKDDSYLFINIWSKLLSK